MCDKGFLNGIAASTGGKGTLDQEVSNRGRSRPTAIEQNIALGGIVILYPVRAVTPM